MWPISNFIYKLGHKEDWWVSLWSLHNMTFINNTNDLKTNGYLYGVSNIKQRCLPQVFFLLPPCLHWIFTGCTYHTSWLFATDALSLIMLYIALYLAQMWFPFTSLRIPLSVALHGLLFEMSAPSELPSFLLAAKRFDVFYLQSSSSRYSVTHFF